METPTAQQASNQDLNAFLAQLQAQVNSLTQQNKVLHQQVALLQQQSTTQVLTPAPSAGKIKVNKPKEFHGDNREETTSFLAQCQLVFTSDPSNFADHNLRINYAVSYLRGNAFKWYEAAIFKVKRSFTSFDEFETLFLATFGHDTATNQDKAYADLQRLIQNRSVQSFATKFIQLSACVMIDDSSKIHLFKNGLKSEIKLHLIGLRPQPTTLSEIMQAAIEYDDALFSLTKGTAKLQFSRHASTSSSTSVPSTSTSTVTPMDLDSVQLRPTSTTRALTKAEKDQRKAAGVCIYDGNPECPGKDGLDKCPAIAAKRLGNGPRQAAK